jgi:hypothetical protein
MSFIDGIPVNSMTIRKCYETYYGSSTFTLIDNKNYFHYLHLFGIRMSTSDTSKLDDFLGGFRVTNLNLYESVVGSASLDPSPSNLQKFFDAEARAKGGTAFVREGQHLYYYIGNKHKKWNPYPAFCPKPDKQGKGAKVYRWMPEQPVITAYQKYGKPPLSAGFEAEMNKLKLGQPSRAKYSDSSDTCIHRAWRKDNLTNDSAGCQVTANYDLLNTLGKWANEHISKKYGNLFTYTVFTKEQFIQANRPKSTKRDTTRPTPIVVQRPAQSDNEIVKFLKDLLGF